ncbi:MAG: EcsC family protein [Clostridium sulfidigenes]|uniref:EcsC family protein n=1 Tax=Clostridium sulfidigenes TaxID=318464 RepID=A0A927W1K3_9CLOT|nr:EcsC family protein [Clostridium sulfidigenes]
MMEEINKNTMLKILDSCYDMALSGLSTSESVYNLADEYCKKYSDPKVAAKKMCNIQVVKCGTSGFITGLGGLITLPVAIPANVASVIYVQLRMIATVAKIGGYDPSDDQVRTMAYVCLTGSAAADIIKKAGINIGEKITVSAIKKIPGAVLTKINQKVGFRLLTKFGEKGAINLVKLVPVVGGVVGGGIDVVGSKAIAKVAYDMFIECKI